VWQTSDGQTEPPLINQRITRCSATTKSTARLSCLLGVLLHFSGENLLMANQPLLCNAKETTEFGEITQNIGHYAVQDHWRSLILAPIESPCDFQLVIDSNLNIRINFTYPETRRIVLPDTDKKLIRRWDNERELSLRRYRTRTTKYNRLVHKFLHSSTRRLCVGTYVYQIQWNNAMQRPLRRSRSFKVTYFGTNRKLIYDFLLVINTNLHPILHRFQVTADYSSNFR